MDEYEAFVLREAQHAKLPHGYRLYTSDLGARNILALEIDFEGFEEYDRFWRSWQSVDPRPVFDEKYAALVEHDIANEIWERVE
jgi:hypothetical protein